MKLRAILSVLVVASVALVGCSDSTTNPDNFDTTPPLAPVIVDATATNGYLGVWWEPNSEPDLAGYNVYRIDETKPVRLNQFILSGHNMTGVPVDAGQVSVYVTAVDLSGNESAPSSIKEVYAVHQPSGDSNDQDGKKERSNEAL